MADAVVGQAWVDVSLRPKNFEKDAEKATNAAGKKIEAFFDKYSKESFFEKYSRRSEEAKALLLLPTDKALEAAAIAKMSFVDRVMARMGAKINQTGMMGAQLSYAAQDFVTGLSMGNLNQALLGASNNLGMMAMQISSAAAAWTTLGLVAIPLAITAIKAFGGEADNTKEAIDRLNRALEMQRQGFKLNAIARQVLTDEEIRELHGVGNIQGKIKGESKALEEVNSQIKEQTNLKKERGLEAATGLIREGALPAEDELIKDILAHPAPFKPAGMDFTPEEQARIIGQLGLKIPAGGIEGRYKVTKGPEGGAVVYKKATEDEKANALKEAAKIGETLGTLNAERKKHEANVEKLRERHAEEVNDEMEFRRREQKAGFNQYELDKIKLDRQEKEQLRQNRESGAADIITGRQILSPEHLAVESEAIDREAREKAGKIFTEREQVLARKRRGGALQMGFIDVPTLDQRFAPSNRERIRAPVGLSKKEEADFRKRLEGVEKDRMKKQQELQMDVLAPKTALDEMNEATRAEFKKKRLQLAEQSAGGGGHFTSIEGLLKDVQSAASGDKRLQTDEQIRDNTKGMLDALHDIETAIKNQNTGVGP